MPYSILTRHKSDLIILYDTFYFMFDLSKVRQKSPILIITIIMSDCNIGHIFGFKWSFKLNIWYFQFELAQNVSKLSKMSIDAYFAYFGQASDFLKWQKQNWKYTVYDIVWKLVSSKLLRDLWSGERPLISCATSDQVSVTVVPTSDSSSGNKLLKLDCFWWQ